MIFCGPVLTSNLVTWFEFWRGFAEVKWKTMSSELSYSQLRTANEARQSVSDNTPLYTKEGWSEANF